MSEVEVLLLSDAENCTVYSIQFQSENESEFEKFYNRFKDCGELSEDFGQIFRFIRKIFTKGSLERFFRPEGKMRDGVGALPTVDSKLRVYCLRLSDKILVLGNGGIKTSQTYQEDDELAGYVVTLQRFEQFIKDSIHKGNILIREVNIDWNNIP